MFHEILISVNIQEVSILFLIIVNNVLLSNVLYFI